VGDDEGLGRWIDVLLRHVVLDAPMRELTPLAALSRRLEPEYVRNVVVPGRVGTAGSQSVVYLGEDAARVFLDLRPDAVIGEPQRPEQTTTTSSTSTTEATTTTTSGGVVP
jgi:hypothetical protein